jgi:hypothetical protein
MKLADETFAAIPEDERWRITAGNALGFFNIKAE